jgi:Protein of unknown function (DUF3054)
MKSPRFLWLLVGDIVTLGLVTIFGFATHGTLGSAGVRILSTFLPVVMSWFLVAPFLGAYRLEWVVNWRQLWRPFWAMVLAAPFAAWMRAVWLENVVIPIFVVVLGGISAIAILIWRLVYWIILTRLDKSNG